MATQDFKKLLSQNPRDLSSLSPAQIDERLKLVKEAIRQAGRSNANTTFHPTTFKPRTARKAFGTYGVSDKLQELLDAEEELRDLLNLEGGAGTNEGGCPKHDPCKGRTTMT